MMSRRLFLMAPLLAPPNATAEPPPLPPSRPPNWGAQWSGGSTAPLADGGGSSIVPTPAARAQDIEQPPLDYPLGQWSQASEGGVETKPKRRAAAGKIRARSCAEARDSRRNFLRDSRSLAPREAPRGALEEKKKAPAGESLADLTARGADAGSGPWERFVRTLCAQSAVHEGCGAAPYPVWFRNPFLPLPPPPSNLFDVPQETDFYVDAPPAAAAAARFLKDHQQSIAGAVTLALTMLGEVIVQTVLLLGGDSGGLAAGGGHSQRPAPRLPSRPLSSLFSNLKLLANLELGRALRIGCVTSGLAMGATYNWYRLTDWAAPPREANSITVAAKIIAEEILFTPIFNSVYLICVPVALGEGVAEGLKSWSAKFKTVTYTNACVWPLLNMANYSKWMPSHLRQIFVNLENLCWLTYLTLYCNH
mmetsp:Transcript_48044/g.109124  ORF Transcript_48044/g.109124 Transcript_48044/m.109124 type:complete len:421 (+) Transcript_48044:237-1499(+)